MRGINFKSDFCENFFNTSTSIATEYKINFLKKLIRNDTIYKFIQFNDNEDLNYVKLSSLKNQSLWFSHSRFLNDDTEYEITYSSKKVLNKLKSNNFNQDSLNMFIGALQDVYELCSFTYENTPYMWETYSNKDNGICIEFKVCDYDQLYPVIYAEKSKVDFNKLISDSINNNTMNPRSFFEQNDPMSILPFILKNPQNGTMDSTKEKEIRMFYAPTDKSEFNDGYIYKNSKKELKFNGISVRYDDVQLVVKKVVVGKGCNLHLLKKIKEICEEQNVKMLILEK